MTFYERMENQDTQTLAVWREVGVLNHLSQSRRQYNRWFKRVVVPLARFMNWLQAHVNLFFICNMQFCW